MPLIKDYYLSTVSTAGFDRSLRVSRIVNDGRADLLDEGDDQPSGLGARGLTKARCLLRKPRLALGALVGDDAEGTLFRDNMRAAEIDTGYILGIPAGTTNRQWVFEAKGDQKYIVRLGGVSYERDLDPQHVRRFKGMVARSRSTLVGHLPFELTAELLGWGPRVSTFLALAPGAKQLDGLADLPCDLLVLNHHEAADAVKAGPGADAAEVFARLVELVPRAARVVQTGGGANPTYLVDRTTGRSWAAEPADLGCIARSRWNRSTVGAGDVVAATLALGLGLGQVLDVAWHWASVLVTAHIVGVTFTRRDEAAAWFEEHRPAFSPIREHTVRRFAA